jgi:hypothetical protein
VYHFAYYENYILSLNRDEEFHTRDIDSSSLYTKPDHDILMTLSALRTKLLPAFPRRVRGHQGDKCDFAQLNVLADYTP